MKSLALSINKEQKATAVLCAQVHRFCVCIACTSTQAHKPVRRIALLPHYAFCMHAYLGYILGHLLDRQQRLCQLQNLDLYRQITRHATTRHDTPVSTLGLHHHSSGNKQPNARTRGERRAYHRWTAVVLCETRCLMRVLLLYSREINSLLQERTNTGAGPELRRVL